jgi:hypothetical protein
VNATDFLRSSVIVIEAMIASYLRALSAGMMPSQSCWTSSHSTFICSHKAQAMSISKPSSLPFGVTWLNGG